MDGFIIDRVCRVTCLFICSRLFNQEGNRTCGEEESHSSFRTNFSFLLSEPRRSFSVCEEERSRPGRREDHHLLRLIKMEIERMDWDLLKDTDELFSTPTFDPLPPIFPDNWNQLDFATSPCMEQINTPRNFDQTPLEELSFNSPKMKTVKKEPSQQINRSDFTSPDPIEEWIEGLNDSQMLNLDQADNIFLNSFSNEDVKPMNCQAEPSQTVPNHLEETLSFESSMANMQNDPSNYLINQNNMETTSFGLDACTNALLSEDFSSVNSFLTSQSPSIMIDSGGSTAEKSIWVPDVANQNCCSDATILQDLESTLLKINGETRICFRDSLYRMANNSNRLKYINEKRTRQFHYEPYSLPPNSRVYGSEQMEDETNVIDRAVANLMFNNNLPCGGPTDTWAPHTNALQHVEYAAL